MLVALTCIYLQLDYLESVYGFSTILTLVGNVVNSDAGLANVYMTANAEGVSIDSLSVTGVWLTDALHGASSKSHL